MKKKKKQYPLTDSVKDAIEREIRMFSTSLLDHKIPLCKALQKLSELETFLHDGVDETLYEEVSYTMEKFGNVLAIKLGYESFDDYEDRLF